MPIASCLSAAEMEQLFLGGLTEEEAQAREQHLLTCAICLEKLKALTRTRDTLADLLSQDTHREGGPPIRWLPT